MRGFRIDFHKAEDTEPENVLYICNSSDYVFSNFSIFTNYCFNVISFNNDEIDTNVDNYKCVFTDEEGKGLV